jgi:hypothetical protein
VWRYIRNLTPDRLYSGHLMGRTEHNAYWGTWLYHAGKNEHARHLIESVFSYGRPNTFAIRGRIHSK